MGISDLYMSIGLKRNISHFANMVKVARSDNFISVDEANLLKKIAKKYNISDEKFKEILKDPDNTPTIAHIDCEERIERFYDLMQMVYADHKTADEEVFILRRIVTGLAFPLQNVDKIVERAVDIDIDHCDLETFQKEILIANKF